MESFSVEPHFNVEEDIQLEVFEQKQKLSQDLKRAPKSPETAQPMAF